MCSGFWVTGFGLSGDSRAGKLRGMNPDTSALARDPELVRAILLWAEKGGVPSARPGEITVALCFHVKIMIAAGLIEGDGDYYRAPGSEEFRPGIAYVKELTWQGAEVLAALRIDTFWEKAKKTLVKHELPLLFALVVAWGKKELKDRAGIELP
jgi:hypothetical protein